MRVIADQKAIAEVTPTKKEVLTEAMLRSRKKGKSQRRKIRRAIRGAMNTSTLISAVI